MLMTDYNKISTICTNIHNEYNIMSADTKKINIFIHRNRIDKILLFMKDNSFGMERDYRATLINKPTKPDVNNGYRMDLDFYSFYKQSDKSENVIERVLSVGLLLELYNKDARTRQLKYYIGVTKHPYPIDNLISDMIMDDLIESFNGQRSEFTKVFNEMKATINPDTIDVIVKG